MDEYYYIEELESAMDSLAEENERLRQKIAHYEKVIEMFINKEK